MWINATIIYILKGLLNIHKITMWKYFCVVQIIGNNRCLTTGNKILFVLMWYYLYGTCQSGFKVHNNCDLFSCRLQSYIHWNLYFLNHLGVVHKLCYATKLLFWPPCHKFSKQQNFFVFSHKFFNPPLFPKAWRNLRTILYLID